MDDDSFSCALRSPSNKKSPLMQFNESDPNGRTHSNQVSNNNNNIDNLFSVASKASIETTSSTTTQINQGSNDQLTGQSSSPHLSSNSSVSSHAQNNDDCDTAVQVNNSPSSPQSSYNSSFGSNSGRKLINSSNSSITALVPGGVVTTQNISTVIKPKSNNNSLQFVKIQTPELSKKAVEQIRIAEETKISKDKIKEVEEEWQNNLLNWKSKRRQQITHTVEPNDPFETSDNCGGRKIKTFAEMIEQRAKSGNRLGFHLQRYIGAEDDEEEQLSTARDATSNFLNDAEQSKNWGIDSDCEAHSSTSSGYNQLDSKSPSSSDTPIEVAKDREPPNHNEFRSSTCDSNPNDDLPRDERDNHSISLVESSEPDKLNSTLIQGIKSPPSIPQPNSNGKQHALIIDSERPKSKEVSARIDDESDNSGFEEGDEEEAEQKHLQRIAFEAKLKAFENLTKPTTHKPRFAPSRVAVKNLVTQANPPPLAPYHTAQSEVKNPVPPANPPPLAPYHIAQSEVPPHVISNPIPTKQQQTGFNHNNVIHKHPNVGSNVPPESPSKNNAATNIQRKPSKDDKDRTVLSVSGKKRCSSCKEELGRGAAAFVVESLSLVYHTNCFRCSVCHANLANGFRGVDVRVHAGALHCQNCYSKDGLNYSRV